MVKRFYSSIPRQLAFMIAANAIAFAGAYYFAFRIYSRITAPMLVVGMVVGVSCLGVLLAVDLLLALIRPGTELAESQIPQSKPVRLGAAIAAAAGEEPLLRGFIVGGISRHSAAAALIVNFFCSGILSADLPLAANRLLPALIIGTGNAISYQLSKSLFAAFIGRFAFELLYEFATLHRIAPAAAAKIRSIGSKKKPKPIFKES